MARFNFKKIAIGIAIALVILVILGGGVAADRLWGFKPLDRLFPRPGFRVGDRSLDPPSPGGLLRGWVGWSWRTVRLKDRCKSLIRKSTLMRQVIPETREGR